jgi:Rrf2 family protein
MDRIIGISDGSIAGLHALALAAVRGGTISAAEAAARLAVSPTYLSKILKTLAKAGMLESTRGAAGGFALIRKPGSLSCGEVVTCIEGELPDRACLFERPVCEAGHCAFSTFCTGMEKRLRSLLSKTTIADLAGCFTRE